MFKNVKCRLGQILSTATATTAQLFKNVMFDTALHSQFLSGLRIGPAVNRASAAFKLRGQFSSRASFEHMKFGYCMALSVIKWHIYLTNYKLSRGCLHFVTRGWFPSWTSNGCMQFDTALHYQLLSALFI